MKDIEKRSRSSASHEVQTILFPLEKINHVKYDYTICYLVVRQIQCVIIRLLLSKAIHQSKMQSYFRKLTFSNLSKIYHQLNHHFLLILFWRIWHSKCVEKEGGEKENLIWLKSCFSFEISFESSFIHYDI